VKRFRESLKNSSIMAESLEKDEIVENTKLDLLDEDEIEDKNIQ
jgi:hypothetical protein